jgi:hypothetical protein
MSDAATSSPMKPAPMITALRELRALSMIARASARLRR